MHASTDHPNQSEVAILARILGKQNGKLPATMARYVLSLGFNDQDKARMHDLAVRNQQDALAPGEKEEMLAYSKAGSLLGILKSKARRTLNIKPNKPTTS
jgi:hypothetical protein